MEVRRNGFQAASTRDADVGSRAVEVVVSAMPTAVVR
jgi:hypothetical protein